MTLHAMERLEERYDLRPSWKDFRDLTKAVHAGEGFVMKETPDAKEIELPFMGQLIRVVLSKYTNQIMTVTPTEHQRMNCDV